MSIPVRQYVDDAGYRWAVDDFAQLNSELALVPLGDLRAKGRVFIGADEIRVYFFAPEYERAPLEDFLSLQLRSALR